MRVSAAILLLVVATGLGLLVAQESCPGRRPDAPQSSGTPAVPVPESSGPPGGEGGPSRETPTRQAAEQPAETTSRTGELRVGSERDFVPFLGDGRLTLEVGPEPLHRIDVTVQKGRFACDLPEGATARVVEGQLHGLAIRLVSPIVLLEDRPSHVYFTWGDRRVHVAVLDRDSGEHLNVVDVWREPRLRFGYQDPVFSGDRWLSPRAEDERLLSGISSPFDLVLPAGVPDRLWISSPGYVPFRYRFPSGLPQEDLVVGLRRGGGVEVEIQADTEALEQSVLRVYRAGLAEMPWLPPPVVECAAAPRQRIDGLLPGAYGLQLVHAPDPPGKEAVLAQASFEVEEAREAAVLLRARSLEEASVDAEVTIELPSPSSIPPGAGSARLIRHGAQSRPGSTERETAWSGEQEWGPLAVEPGPYTLALLPDNVSLPFSLEPGEVRRLRVPAYQRVTCFLTILDDQTGEPARPSYVYWSCALDWDGSASGWQLGHRKALDIDEFPLRLNAPRTPLRVLVGAEGYGSQQHVVDLALEGDPVVMLHPLACLEFELVDMDEIPTAPWLWGIELFANGVEVEPDSSMVVTQDGISRGQVYFPGSGSLVVHLPPLPSQGSLVPIQVEVERGEHRRVLVGPQHLLRVD